MSEQVHGEMVRTVTIPAMDEHQGFYSRKVRLYWYCDIHGEERGEPFPTVSYDGSRRLAVDGWRNPCGCVDKYSSVRFEAKVNGLNEPSGNETDFITKDDQVTTGDLFFDNDLQEHIDRAAAKAMETPVGSTVDFEQAFGLKETN